MAEKKIRKKTAAAPPEKHFAAMVKIYFRFHEKNFKDQDGYPLSPDWNPLKRGMESKGLKNILITLRQIAEGKNIEWTEKAAEKSFIEFLEKAYTNIFYRKNFMCIMLNKYKVDILTKTYNPEYVKLILETWYYEFPNYIADVEKDKAAAEIIVGYFKQRYLVASIEFSKESVCQSMRTIIRTIKCDEFWSKKSLKSIANNFQDIVNKIKSNGRVQNSERGIGRQPVPTIKPSGSLGDL